jgi:hypothetical protein
LSIPKIGAAALLQQTMEAKAQTSLYFIGEVVDITSWLGGYHLQWAWSSGHACAQAMAARRPWASFAKN